MRLYFIRRAAASKILPFIFKLRLLALLSPLAHPTLSTFSLPPSLPALMALAHDITDSVNINADHYRAFYLDRASSALLLIWPGVLW